MLASRIVFQSLNITIKINYRIFVVFGDVDKPSTTVFPRKIQSIHVNLAMHGMTLLLHLLRFSINYFQLCDGPLEHGESMR